MWLALEEEASCTDEVVFCTALAVRERRSGSCAAHAARVQERRRVGSYTALAARQLPQERSWGSCAATAARGAAMSGSRSPFLPQTRFSLVSCTDSLALLGARVLSLLEVCCAQACAVALLPRYRVRRLLPALVPR